MAKKGFGKKLVAGALRATSAVASLAGRDGFASLTSSLATKLTVSNNPIKESSKQLSAGMPPAATTPQKASAIAFANKLPPVASTVMKQNSQSLTGTSKGANTLTPQGQKVSSKGAEGIFDGISGKSREKANVLYIVGGLVFALIVLAMMKGGKGLKKMFS